MRLLQVCNVGRIVGGTAACAWTITRAFPDVEHHVAFLAEIAPETRGTFAPATLHRVEHLTNRFVRDLGIDAVILHNTSATRMERISSAWTLQYVHSAGPRGPPIARSIARNGWLNATWVRKRPIGMCSTRQFPGPARSPANCVRIMTSSSGGSAPRLPQNGPDAARIL